MSPDGLSRHADEAMTRYARIRPQYEQCAAKISDLLTVWLDEEQVNYQSVSARAKTLKSFREKAGRGARPGSSEPRYPKPLGDMTDLMGARVITYLPEAVERACEVVKTVIERGALALANVRPRPADGRRQTAHRQGWSMLPGAGTRTVRPATAAHWRTARPDR